MPVIMTRRDYAAELLQRGVTGAALEALLSETAQERHRSRVAYAKWVAEEFYLASANLRREEVSKDVLTLFAGAILRADIVGIGGRCGVEGMSTARHPAFAGCGKGRKHATDGAAWSAAIRDAAHQCGGCFCVNIDIDGRVLLAFAREELINNEWRLCDDVIIDETVLPGPWMLSICREGLRRAAGVRPHSESGVVGWHSFCPIEAPPETLANWAQLVNQVSG